MFVYEKKLQYPVKITNPNPKTTNDTISKINDSTYPIATTINKRTINPSSIEFIHDVIKLHRLNPNRSP